MKARVIVTLKTGVLDPQGKAIEGALASLGIDGIASVRQGKVFDLELGPVDRSEAEGVLARACERLLANMVIENYRIELPDSPAPQPVPAVEETVASAAAEPAPPPLPPLDPTEIAARDAEMPREGHP